MIGRRLWQLLARHAVPADHTPPESALQHLPAPDRTAALIRRQEALRARGRPPFSVVVVEVGDGEQGRSTAAHVLETFRRRSRCGDEIGWLAPNKLALILPLTDLAGARHVARQLCGADTIDPSTGRFRVFSQ